MTLKELVNKMIGQLSATARQEFYEEYGRRKARGASEEDAVGEAFRKIGIADPFRSLKISTGEGVAFGIKKKGSA